MTTTIQQITAEDLFRIPNDGFCYELIQGELKKMSPPGSQHGRIIMNISAPLYQHVRKKQLGTVYAAETGFKITSNPDTVRAPDVAFVSRERVRQVGDIVGYWPGAPDLAVEVISPNDVYTEVEEKAFDWLEAGAQMVIVVNPPTQVVTVFRSRNDIVMLTKNDALETGDVIPGWSIAVNDIFALQ
ncbi:MAG: Uma2 family endonuclease [Candidatus Omnitrophota bacterium]|nr:MAG: Uma2 family endonuclease [Candidatus Omnitrophota bacterium]